MIVAVKKGEVVETGTHDELMALNGVYNELVTLQVLLKLNFRPLLIRNFTTFYFLFCSNEICIDLTALKIRIILRIVYSLERDHLLTVKTNSRFYSVKSYLFRLRY